MAHSVHPTGSEARLWELVAQRKAPGAEVNAASHAFTDAVRGTAGLSFEEVDESIPGTDRAYKIEYAHAT